MKIILVMAWFGVCAVPWHSDCLDTIIQGEYKSLSDCEKAKNAWKVISPDYDMVCMSVTPPEKE